MIQVSRPYRNKALCILDIFAYLFCRLMIFSKSSFSKISFRNTVRLSNSVDPDQTVHFVEPDRGLNCFQRLSADDTSRQS